MAKSMFKEGRRQEAGGRRVRRQEAEGRRQEGKKAGGRRQEGRGFYLFIESH
ncbi:MAG: hypothetical protein F6K21_18700 [Symploca sp. SIO2D2]|nr:hypothetical protein [Symploca sp. SIO2D2]